MPDEIYDEELVNHVEKKLAYDNCFGFFYPQKIDALSRGQISAGVIEIAQSMSVHIGNGNFKSALDLANMVLGKYKCLFVLWEGVENLLVKQGKGQSFEEFVLFLNEIGVQDILHVFDQRRSQTVELNCLH